ncbi:hypothetical protein [Acidihalobacter ferrooxydans]|uniref:Uncharacterized protein n=1 Tax=Acidihalobacter ferrooxydans TaxID=1765967 RepID=A0A1P8UDM3_9GAMM|nr:hypothetical protein [Acidihalobacter ferrooxydans]APZ41967.1 hypothetical protein BW247_01690 [Acidihalobacter ferrooxydans]
MFGEKFPPSDVIDKLNELMTSLQGHLQETHKTMLARRETAARAGAIIQQVVESAAGWEQLAKEGMELAAKFATEGMELGYEFATHGMDLGYEFASRGEAVGPMANRVLFMAVQIGVMADRIGEMSDRILFMADKIGEFGDKILYESQLVIYTEQLIIDESVLLENAIRTFAEVIAEGVATVTGNAAFFEYKRAVRESSQDVYEHIYGNMNLMLSNMHEYSLAVLQKEERDRERELQVRELQVKLREATLSANACYCPCFCTDTVPAASGSAVAPTGTPVDKAPGDGAGTKPVE